MPFVGPGEARADAKRALALTFLDSLKLAAGGWAAFATIAAGLLGVAATKNWLAWSDFKLSMALLVVALPSLLLAFEVRRLCICRAALNAVLLAEVAYDDVLREARQERDEAKTELQLQGAQAELRLAQVRSFYEHQVADAVRAKDKPE